MKPLSGIDSAFLFLYSVARFFLETVRGDAERGFVFGGALSTSQLICAVLAVMAVVMYLALDRRHRASGEPDWRPAGPPAASAAVPAGRAGRSKAAKRSR